MSTEPKPESPAELVADEAIRRMYALRDEVWKSARGSEDVDVGEAMSACRGAIEKLAALATIQAASQEPVVRERGKEWHAALSAAGAYAESCQGLMATPSTNAWMALKQALDALAAAQARPASGEAEDDVERIIREVSELPDRSSPDDWPEAMLVTADELRRIVKGE